MAKGRLGREIGKRSAFATPQEEAVLNLLRTADRVQIRFARLFREHGLTPSQYNVLRILRGEGKPLPILEVADRLLTVVPGITGLIDRLEALGLVARHRCDRDRRVVYAAITPAGVERLAALDEPVRALHVRVLAGLTVEEVRTLNDLLERTRAAVGDQPPD